MSPCMQVMDSPTVLPQCVHTLRASRKVRTYHQQHTHGYGVLSVRLHPVLCVHSEHVLGPSVLGYILDTFLCWLGCWNVALMLS